MLERYWWRVALVIAGLLCAATACDTGASRHDNSQPSIERGGGGGGGGGY
jgi:hypothetical protein